MIINVIITVECDGCGDEDTWDRDDLVEEYKFREQVAAEEWAVNVGRNGPEWLCPECAAKLKDEDE
jgi:hypothetical protein